LTYPFLSPRKIIDKKQNNVINFSILVESRRAMFGGTIALLIGSFILAND